MTLGHSFAPLGVSFLPAAGTTTQISRVTEEAFKGSASCTCGLPWASRSQGGPGRRLGSPASPGIHGQALPTPVPTLHLIPGVMRPASGPGYFWKQDSVNQQKQALRLCGCPQEGTAWSSAFHPAFGEGLPGWRSGFPAGTPRAACSAYRPGAGRRGAGPWASTRGNLCQPAPEAVHPLVALGSRSPPLGCAPRRLLHLLLSPLSREVTEPCSPGDLPTVALPAAGRKRRQLDPHGFHLTVGL